MQISNEQIVQDTVNRLTLEIQELLKGVFSEQRDARVLWRRESLDALVTSQASMARSRRLHHNA